MNPWNTIQSGPWLGVVDANDPNRSPLKLLRLLPAQNEATRICPGDPFTILIRHFTFDIAYVFPSIMCPSARNRARQAGRKKLMASAVVGKDSSAAKVVTKAYPGAALGRVRPQSRRHQENEDQEQRSRRDSDECRRFRSPR